MNKDLLTTELDGAIDQLYTLLAKLADGNLTEVTLELGLTHALKHVYRCWNCRNRYGKSLYGNSEKEYRRLCAKPRKLKIFS